MSVQNGSSLHLDTNLHRIQQSQVFLPLLLLHDHRSLSVLVLFLQSHKWKNCTFLLTRRARSHDCLVFHRFLSFFCRNHDLLPHHRTHSDALHKFQDNGRNEIKKNVSSPFPPKRIKTLTSKSIRQRIDPKHKTILWIKMVSLVHSNRKTTIAWYISITNGPASNSLQPDERNKPLLSWDEVSWRNEEAALCKSSAVLQRKKDEDQQSSFSSFFFRRVTKMIVYSVIVNLFQHHTFIAHPQSGMKASKIVLRLSSSDGSNFPSFLILANKAVWPPLKWAMNLASNLEIYEVTILSRYPLTPAKMTQTCYSATMGTWISSKVRIAFA